MKDTSHKLTRDMLLKAKKLGFSDIQIAEIFGSNENIIRQLRLKHKVVPVYKTVDTCAAEFEAKTPYYYSSYDEENESTKSKKKKVVILGGGPNRIGQGIEFDYCCTRASSSFKKAGYESIMINCNPETVSTDYDVSDKLYFEPLSFEDVINVLEHEKPFGVAINFGGQTPLKLSALLSKKRINILGTSSKNIDLAEDRKKFCRLLKKLDIPHPKYGTAKNRDEVVKIANQIGYPVLVRPSYVLGGRAMKIIYNDESMQKYAMRALSVSEEKPLLIDSFLERAEEFDIDALSDSSLCVVVGIMKHIESAGIHSGDSSSILPPIDTPKHVINQIKSYTIKIAKALNVIGLMNVQVAVQNGKVYVLEVNPRASRTVPFVCKASGIPMIDICCALMLGEKIPALKKKHPMLKHCDEQNLNHICIKEPVFPFSRFANASVYLGPEMRSTGEVMSFAKKANFGEAFFKAGLAAGNRLPTSGNILVSLNDSDKNDDTIELLKSFYDIGFDFIATIGTAKFINEHGIECKQIYKRGEGRPDVTDIISLKRVQFVINTPIGEKARHDELAIGSAVVKTQVSYVTTIEAAKAALAGIQQNRKKSFSIRSLQKYLKKKS